MNIMNPRFQAVAVFSSSDLLARSDGCDSSNTTLSI